MARAGTEEDGDYLPLIDYHHLGPVYYIVWVVQPRILRYCGARVLAWTVLGDGPDVDASRFGLVEGAPNLARSDAIALDQDALAGESDSVVQDGSASAVAAEPRMFIEERLAMRSRRTRITLLARSSYDQKHCQARTCDELSHRAVP